MLQQSLPLSDADRSTVTQPAIGVFHILYGVYHLARSATGRTPATSYSYALFSSLSDAALLPFYAWTLLLSRSQYSLSPNMDWTSIFTNLAADKTIVWAIFLFSAALTGLHGISLFIDLYLAIVFRRIARLPPDMNPLEGHLTRRDRKTARKHGAHKAKDSMASISTMQEKRTSRSTISSLEDPLVVPPKTLPFMHTRTASTDASDRQDQAITLPNRTSTPSRSDLPSQRHAYQQSHTPQSSISDLRRSRAKNTYSPLPEPKATSIYEDIPVPPSRSRRTSLSAYDDLESSGGLTENRSNDTNRNWNAHRPYSQPSFAEPENTASAYDSHYDQNEIENMVAMYQHLATDGAVAQVPRSPSPTKKQRKGGYEVLRRDTPTQQPLQGRTATAQEGSNWDRISIPDPLSANPLPSHRTFSSVPMRSAEGGMEEFDLNTRQVTPSTRYEDLRAGMQPEMIGGKSRDGRKEYRGDYGSGGEDEIDMGDGRARNVSGIAVEEGRGGNGWARLRKVSGLSYY